MFFSTTFSVGESVIDFSFRNHEIFVFTVEAQKQKGLVPWSRSVLRDHFAICLHNGVFRLMVKEQIFTKPINEFSFSKRHSYPSEGC